MAPLNPEVVHVTHVQKRQYKYYNIMVLFAMSFASIAMGYSASIIATTLAQPSFIEYFELDTRSDAISLISTANGLFQAGAFFGSVAINFVADRWGRKMAIIVPSVLVLVSGAVMAGSVNIAMFIVFRFFAGAGSFMLLGAIPVWMSEITPPKNRGVLVDFHSAALLLGYALSTYVGYGFFRFHPKANNQWRAPLGFQALPATVVLIFMHWLPESPRWLIQNDRFEEAEKVLLKLHDSDEAALELAQIKNQILVDRTLPNSWLSMFTKPSYRKRSFYAMGLTIGVQMTGVLVINNYGPTIYASLGFDTNQQLLYQVGFITLSVGCGFAALLLVDRLPRPKLIALGMSLCMTCLIIEAAIVASFPTGPNQNNAALKAGVAMIFCYQVPFELMLSGTQYIYLAEMFPNHLRAKGMTIGMASISLINIMWLQCAPLAFANIGWKFYLAFIIPGSIFVGCIFFLFPDTKGLPLEEIAAIFGDADELYQGPNEIGKLSIDGNEKHLEHQDV